MAFASNNRGLLERFKSLLSKTVKVKLLSQLQMFIGWEVTYNRHCTYAGQQKYIQRVLTEYNMVRVKTSDKLVPIKCNFTITTDKDEKL